jgi:hypothetical protein
MEQAENKSSSTVSSDRVILSGMELDPKVGSVDVIGNRCDILCRFVADTALETVGGSCYVLTAAKKWSTE